MFLPRMLVALAVMACLASSAHAEGKKIGVSWSNFQEARWRFDSIMMRSAIERAGNEYVAVDAQGSMEKQLDDINKMIADGVDALVILAIDKEEILPAIDWAAEAGIPVLGYDRMIEDARVFYLTFDNVGVGRIIAAMIRQVRPEGNYAIIMGDPSDPNVAFLRRGMDEVIGAAVSGGAIRIVGEANADGWKPENAKVAMEKILADNGNAVDAVLVQNDGMAGSVIEALAAAGLSIPVGGQDGDPDAINRVAQGTQTVSVWKNNRALGKMAGQIANQLADDVPMERIPEAIKFNQGEKGVEVNAILLQPTPITVENIDVIIDAGQIEERVACKDALPGVPACE
jgi:D-xylose transport system substrate-binding protein